MGKIRTKKDEKPRRNGRHRRPPHIRSKTDSRPSTSRSHSHEHSSDGHDWCVRRTLQRMVPGEVDMWRELIPCVLPL
jgi:hypothetical protein